MYAKLSAHCLIPDPSERMRQRFRSANNKIFLEEDHVRCSLDLLCFDALKSELLVTVLLLAVMGKEDKETGSFSDSVVAQIDAAPLRSVKRV